MHIVNIIIALFSSVEDTSSSAPVKDNHLQSKRNRTSDFGDQIWIATYFIIAFAYPYQSLLNNFFFLSEYRTRFQTAQSQRNYGIPNRDMLWGEGSAKKTTGKWGMRPAVQTRSSAIFKLRIQNGGLSPERYWEYPPLGNVPVSGILSPRQRGYGVRKKLWINWFSKQY